MIPLREQEDGGPIPVDAQLLAIAQLVKNCCAVSEMATLPCVFRVCVCGGGGVGKGLLLHVPRRGQCAFVINTVVYFSYPPPVVTLRCSQ